MPSFVPSCYCCSKNRRSVRNRRHTAPAAVFSRTKERAHDCLHHEAHPHPHVFETREPNVNPRQESNAKRVYSHRPRTPPKTTRSVPIIAAECPDRAVGDLPEMAGGYSRSMSAVRANGPVGDHGGGEARRNGGKGENSTGGTGGRWLLAALHPDRLAERERRDGGCSTLFRPRGEEYYSSTPRQRRLRCLRTSGCPAERTSSRPSPGGRRQQRLRSAKPSTQQRRTFCLRPLA